MKILELLVLLLLAAESWISSQEWKKLVQDSLDAQVRDIITWTSLVAGLKACGGVGALKRGQVMHAEISKRGLLEKDVIANAAISMYSKWGQISRKDSTKLRTRVMNSCDVVLLADFQEGGKQCFWERTEATLQELQEAGHRPSFKACSSVSDVDKGQEIHMELVEEGFDNNGYLVGSALASGYAKCGFTVEAQGVFDELNTPKVISGTTLLASHPLHDHACSITGAIGKGKTHEEGENNWLNLMVAKGRRHRDGIMSKEYQSKASSQVKSPVKLQDQKKLEVPEEEKGEKRQCPSWASWTEPYTQVYHDNQVETKEVPNNNWEMQAKESQEEKEKVESEEQNPDEEVGSKEEPRKEGILTDYPDDQEKMESTHPDLQDRVKVKVRLPDQQEGGLQGDPSNQERFQTPGSLEKKEMQGSIPRDLERKEEERKEEEGTPGKGKRKKGYRKGEGTPGSQEKKERQGSDPGGQEKKEKENGPQKKKEMQGSIPGDHERKYGQSVSGNQKGRDLRHPGDQEHKDLGGTLHIKLKDIKFSLQKSIHEWDALNVDHANEVAAFRMQNAANECQIQELMEQVQEKTLQPEQLHQMEASRNSRAEKLHGQQSQLRSTKNELETVKLELAGKKVELENEKLAKPTMIQTLNANVVKLKNQRGRLSGFATALDGHKMAVGNECLANRLHWVEGDQL
ncbi:hypothetical protein L7F22_047014 [Adiantum nelumboides]|nr:hypothetical protein [Adiantum nelumboides]